MINRQDFMKKVGDLFDETNPTEFTLDCRFRDLEEWSSLIGMGLMAMSSDEYKISITPAELQKIQTFEELAQTIDQKLN